MINRILRKNAEKFQLKLNSMKILSAKYIDDYKVQLIFDDKKKNVNKKFGTSKIALTL